MIFLKKQKKNWEKNDKKLRKIVKNYVKLENKDK